MVDKEMCHPDFTSGKGFLPRLSVGSFCWQSLQALPQQQKDIQGHALLRDPHIPWLIKAGTRRSKDQVILAHRRTTLWGWLRLCQAASQFKSASAQLFLLQLSLHVCWSLTKSYKPNFVTMSASREANIYYLRPTSLTFWWIPRSLLNIVGFIKEVYIFLSPRNSLGTQNTHTHIHMLTHVHINTCVVK